MSPEERAFLRQRYRGGWEPEAETYNDLQILAGIEEADRVQWFHRYYRPDRQFRDRDAQLAQRIVLALVQDMEDRQAGRPLSSTVDADDADNWEPVDLVALSRGDLVQPEPTILRRTDGLCLLYGGLTHSISGPAGSGKSWLALWAAVEVLRSGGRVLLLDYESNPALTTARLVALGCSEDGLNRVRYVNPDSAPTGPGFDALLVEHFDLAVIDGVTVALNRSGIAGDSLTNNGNAVAKWSVMLPQRIAAETGAAVVQIDHTNVNPNNGGRATGSMQKSAQITGVTYVVVPVDPFGRGRSGSFDLYLAGGKDRAGVVQGALDGMKTNQHGTLTSHVRVHAEGDTLRLDLTAPPGAAERQATRAEGIKATVWQYVRDHPGANGKAIRTVGKASDVDAARDELLADGHLLVEGGPHGAKMYRIGTPYEPGFDDGDLL